MTFSQLERRPTPMQGSLCLMMATVPNNILAEKFRQALSKVARGYPRLPEAARTNFTAMCCLYVRERSPTQQSTHSRSQTEREFNNNSLYACPWQMPLAKNDAHRITAIMQLECSENPVYAKLCNLAAIMQLFAQTWPQLRRETVIFACFREGW